MLKVIQQQAEQGYRHVAAFMPASFDANGQGNVAVPKHPWMLPVGFFIFIFGYVVFLFPLGRLGFLVQWFFFFGAIFLWIMAGGFLKVPYSGFFQKTDVSSGALETMFLRHTITAQTEAFALHATSHGHNELYQALCQAGQQGYSLASVFDDPAQEVMPGACGAMTMTTPLVLVLHRNPAQPMVQRTYEVVNTPMHVSLSCGAIDASMHGLPELLAQYGAQGFRLGGCYLPHEHFRKGMTEANLPCHLIFEYDGSCAYQFQVNQVYWDLNTQCQVTVDINAVVQQAQQLAHAGWELAALINLPGLRNCCSCGYAQFPVLVVSQARQPGVAPQARLPGVAPQQVGMPQYGQPPPMAMGMAAPPPPPPPVSGVPPVPPPPPGAKF